MASPYDTEKGRRWRALWRDDAGRQRSKTFSTQEAAAEWEHKMAREREDRVLGRNTRARETTLRAFIADTWWPLHIASRPANTRRSYARAVNLAIDPYIGGLAMAYLDTPRIAQWRDDLMADGFTAHHVTEAMRVLSSCLSKAVERGLIVTGANPVRDASKPPKAPGRDPVPLSPEGVEWLRWAFLTYRYGRSGDMTALRSATLVSLLAYGGLRPSEGVGLKVPDVDFEAGGVWVRDVFALDHRVGDTKTHRGRFVDLPAVVMADLRELLWAREALSGAPARGRVWMFPDDNGEVTAATHRNWAGRPWKTARARAAAACPALADELLRAVPKDLRTTSVSAEARAAGRDLDWSRVAARHGHTVQTMQRRYMFVIASLSGAPRLPVAEQIAAARALTGSAAAASLLHERIAERQVPTKLVDMQAVRRRRAS